MYCKLLHGTWVTGQDRVIWAGIALDHGMYLTTNY